MILKVILRINVMLLDLVASTLYNDTDDYMMTP